MFTKIVTKIVGTKNDRQIKKMRKTVTQINSYEEAYRELSDDALKDLTSIFRDRIQAGESLEDILPEAFAAVREAADRALGLRHYDVQMLGGIALHNANIAEMRTGEGKTLVATLPTYLNAIAQRGAHVITVNEYLAARDAEWMRPVYEALGLTVGVNVPGLSHEEKCNAYKADITYGTNTEFGFDYLRDNMAHSSEQRVQRQLNFAIVDEVDSILIDEARTPLIISGAAQDSSKMYQLVNKMVPALKPQRAVEGDEVLDESEQGDFVIDEKHRQVELTEDGHEKVEQMLIRAGLLKPEDSLYSPTNLQLLHFILAGLKAHHLFHREQQYILAEGQVVLIDEHTGRTMEGRRLSEGLHQAIEAKEGVKIQQESQTLASTTYQNYFRLYPKLSGMTGTADTEAFEFRSIYGLDVVVVPTHTPVQRKDLNDLIYLSIEDKYAAIVTDIKELLKTDAPILVGTGSIEDSELVSKSLKKAGIKHEVLNAKQHDREADIIAQAGRPGSVTVATNMAGRGTDIVLGGNYEVELSKLAEPSEQEVIKLREAWQQRHDAVIAAGGLHIIGTVRHESRRIDNQLRGRAGRQGDPGVSRFYLSLDDDLMRIFASDRVKNMMQALGMEKGEAIEHRMVTNAIEKAQRKVEGRNFDIRKSLLEYDDIANEQRQEVYQVRNEILESTDLSEMILRIREDVLADTVADYIPAMSLEENWDVEGLERVLEAEFAVKLPISEWIDAEKDIDEERIAERVLTAAVESYEQKSAEVGVTMRLIEKQVMLQVVDTHWKDHLSNMDHLRQGVNLRAYAQKNPKQEYKRESFELFSEMLSNIKTEMIRFLSVMQVKRPDEAEMLERQRAEAAEKERANAALNQKPAAPRGPRVGRNDPCPCGSGKKFKQCHGQLNK
ncbi:preprotein translocase subunit SecA [Umboniibacter marinipuniceus]|uniref:Protein translocase subunit SecA n=1 Tax=Umboniibacter marinipuniceus TaxID=569599 RepID=A0A3M0ACR8_9GAMM|nr:preprotein translocase subunit SecA [Umboniibacter marinipuniceus]RMA81429.1 protein translocase subunit secA [Umboniibacter marinipuniceus]